mmetsp:Transcript_7659/g.13192  ORF Transcript_7659/g.13192 Transcript_7659/m.13192 type:complete len:225 (+) Transcript_7659:428-1102(+)
MFGSGQYLTRLQSSVQAGASYSIDNYSRTAGLVCNARSATRKGASGSQKRARQMAVVIPLRRCPDEGVQVMLLSSSRGRGYVLPKGGVEKKDKKAERAALREAMEEAGVLGELHSEFDYRAQYLSRHIKRKGNTKGRCDAQCFVMTVHEEMDSWPEQERRERNWYPLSEAKDMCKHAWMAKALCEVEGRLQDDPSLARSMDNPRADTYTELFHDEQVLICTKET